MIFLQNGLFLLLVILLVKPVGAYLHRVFEGERTWLDPVLLPVEGVFHRLLGARATQEMSWQRYALAFGLFSLVNGVVLAGLLLGQSALPWYFPATTTTPMTLDLAVNTAVSFVTTTTWQAYGGETTLSHFSQLLLVLQNFLAGAAGLAVGVAFLRGYARSNRTTLGNFWQDLIRAVWWVLLPFSLPGSLLLVAQGVPMNFLPPTVAATLEGGVQTIAQGPVAALEFIKNLGTNGGGFFNVNAAHPYENPTGLTNFVELLAIVVIPAALTHTFGRMTNRLRDGWVIFWTMTALFVAGLLVCTWAETQVHPALAQTFSGGNLEGKEVRFGTGSSALAAVVTSNGATGSYNSMHDSYQPLGVLVPLLNMLLGEIVYGGLGTGLYSMIFVALMALFIGGLMVGRSPEHIGQRMGPTEMKIIVLYTLLGPCVVLGLTALAVLTEAGRAGLTTNEGTHGFTEIFSPMRVLLPTTAKNMAGLSANSVFYNVTTMIAMLAGRFGLAFLALALAGRFVKVSLRPLSYGSVPSDSLLFGMLLAATAVLVGAMSFLPALALGPILEHFTMHP